MSTKLGSCPSCPARSSPVPRIPFTFLINVLILAIVVCYSPMPIASAASTDPSPPSPPSFYSYSSSVQCGVLHNISSSQQQHNKSQPHCSDLFCTRLIFIDDTKTMGVCVRGADAGEPCESNDDCFFRAPCREDKRCDSPDSPYAETCSNRGDLTYLVMACVFTGLAPLPTRIARNAAHHRYPALYHLVMALGGFIVAMCIFAARSLPPVLGPTVLAGVLYGVANCMGNAAIQTLGVGLAMGVWGIAQVATGWAFGFHNHSGAQRVYSIAGFVLSLLCTFAFLRVRMSPSHYRVPKSHAIQNPNHNNNHTNNNNNNNNNGCGGGGGGGNTGDDDDDDDDELPTRRNTNDTLFIAMNDDTFGPSDPTSAWAGVLRTYRVLFGIAICSIAGALYAGCFAIMDTMVRDSIPSLSWSQDYQVSHHPLDHVFGLLCGVLVVAALHAGTDLAALFCQPLPETPEPVTRFIMPGLLGGAMWGSAVMSVVGSTWCLGLEVVFPIVHAGSPIVTTVACGLLLLGHVTSEENQRALMWAWAMSVGAVVLTALSYWG
eukprot:PhM_4_TR2708/c0_g2_i1/m.93524